MSIPNIEVVFNMELGKEEGNVPVMSPAGITFRLGKTINFADASAVMKISSS